MRTFHNKTRHGCLTCKQRRKRCDLQKPICGVCHRLRLDCVYPDVLRPGNPAADSSSGLPPGLTNFPQPLYQALARQSQLFEIRDFELASHFLQTDPTKLTTIPGLYAIKQLDFTLSVSRYPFLLHGVLAASALHIARTDPAHTEETAQSYITKARHHQHLALSSYIAALNALSSQSCHLIFGFSLILAGIQLAFDCSLASSQTHSLQADVLIGMMVEIFDLMQGSVAIANAASRWIPGCSLETLLMPIRSSSHAEDISLTGSETDIALQSLETGIYYLLQEDTTVTASSTFEPDNNQRDNHTATACTSAISDLRKVFSRLNRTEPQNFKAALSWFAFMNRSYVTLVKARHPAALTVLAYFGVALHALGHAWWLHGIGSKLVLSIECVLRATQGAERWCALLQWPISRVSRNDWMVNPGHTVAAEQLPCVDSGSPSQQNSLFEKAFEYTCLVGFSEE